MIEYVFDPYQVGGYLFLVFAVVFVGYRFLRWYDVLLLCFVTVFAFEIGWEIPSNFVTLWQNDILVLPIVLKHVFMLAPMFLWLYYDWRLGRRWFLGLFVFAVVFEVVSVLFPFIYYGLDGFGFPFVRVVWVVVFVVNILSWRRKLSAC